MQLAAKFWLGLNVTTSIFNVNSSEPKSSIVEWSSHQTLTELVNGEFEADEHPLYTHQIDSTFSAASLRRLRGVRIRFTSNLKDHLRLTGWSGHRELSIYQHRICLEKLCEDLSSPPILNTSIADEALHILDLLFPYHDSQTRKLLEKEHRMSLYAPYHRQKCMDGDRGTSFKYWKRELAEILNLYHGPPETLDPDTLGYEKSLAMGNDLDRRVRHSHLDYCFRDLGHCLRDQTVYPRCRLV
jgi:hypothetical protein